MLEYAIQIGANQEVQAWCNTTLKAYTTRNLIDQTEVEHIIDYLASNAAPKRLRKMSYTQALAGANKWSKANQKKGSNIVDGPEDIKVLHEFSDGTYIVKLLTKKAYQREGYFMAHCVGNYSPDTMTVYSYRDVNNYPHATFEVTKEGSEIRQIKGKGNGPIHPKYINPIITFLQIIGVQLRPSEMKNLGYYHIPENYLGILQKFVTKEGKPVATPIPILGELYLRGN